MRASYCWRNAVNSLRSRSISSRTSCAGAAAGWADAAIGPASTERTTTTMTWRASHKARRTYDTALSSNPGTAKEHGGTEHLCAIPVVDRDG